MRNWIRAFIWIGLGLALGLALGLYLGWELWPTEFVDADPAILREDYRRDYALMAANAYALDGDLEAARLRIYRLGAEEPERWLLSLTVDAILSGRDEQTVILPLVHFAHDLGLESPALAPYLSAAEQFGSSDDVSE